jgi:hypothetical protein
MMRKSLISGASILILLLLASSTSASGNPDARLEGSYSVVGKIWASNDGTTGQVFRKTYRFRSPCGSGSCRRVELIRETRDGSNIASWLRRTGKGVYEGVEHDRKADCGRSVGVSRTPIRVHVLQDELGQATRFRLRGSYRLECPRGRDRLERARLLGQPAT